MRKNENRLVPGPIVYWGDIVGNINDQDDLIEYVRTHGGGGSGDATWGSIQGTLSDQQDLMYEFDKDRKRLSDLEDGTVVPTGTATESWVQNQGYLVQDDLSQYATRQWVTGRGYATEYWVSQDYTNDVLSPACGKAEDNVKDWVVEEGYINQIKTVNNQSLVGEGNINIGGLTPEQEEAIAPLEETSEGMLYTKVFEEQTGYLLPSPFASNGWSYYLYNIDGEVYHYDGRELWKWNPETFEFEIFKYFSGSSTNGCLWKDNSGRFYQGVSVELNFETEMGDNVNLNCLNYYSSGNRHSLWKGQYGIYNIAYSQIFDEDTQTFVNYTVDVPAGYDGSLMGKMLAVSGFWYEDHYVVIYNSSELWELTEYEDHLEITVVSEPYFPLTIDGNGMQTGFQYNIGGDVYYLRSSDTYKLVDGDWERVDFILKDRGSFYFSYDFRGVVYDNYVIGMYDPSYYVSNMYDILNISDESVKETYWAHVKQVAVDIDSIQIIPGQKIFNTINTDILNVSQLQAINGENVNFSLGENTTHASKIKMIVPGSVTLNGSNIATTDYCILNREYDSYGDREVSVVTQGNPPNPYKEYYWTTHTGRLFYSSMYEFDGNQWNAVSNLLPNDDEVFGQYVINTGTNTFYNYNGNTYLWDDSNSEFVLIATNSPMTDHWQVWPCTDSELRSANDHKLVENNGTWSWETDLMNTYHYGMYYVINGDVFCLGLSENVVYWYDESTKTYTAVGRYHSWSEFSFPFEGTIFNYDGQHVYSIDLTQSDPNAYIDEIADINMNENNYYLWFGYYNGNLWYYIDAGNFGYCYAVTEELPEVPDTNGTYVLQAYRDGDEITYEWVEQPGQ